MIWNYNPALAGGLYQQASCQSCPPEYINNPWLVEDPPPQAGHTYNPLGYLQPPPGSQFVPGFGGATSQGFWGNGCVQDGQPWPPITDIWPPRSCWPIPSPGPNPWPVPQPTPVPTPPPADIEPIPEGAGGTVATNNANAFIYLAQVYSQAPGALDRVLNPFPSGDAGVGQAGALDLANLLNRGWRFEGKAAVAGPDYQTNFVDPLNRDLLDMVALASPDNLEALRGADGDYRFLTTTDVLVAAELDGDSTTLSARDITLLAQEQAQARALRSVDGLAGLTDPDIWEQYDQNPEALAYLFNDLRTRLADGSLSRFGVPARKAINVIGNAGVYDSDGIDNGMNGRIYGLLTSGDAKDKTLALDLLKSLVSEWGITWRQEAGVDRTKTFHSTYENNPIYGDEALGVITTLLQLKTGGHVTLAELGLTP